MESQIAKGRRLVLAVIVASLSISGIVIIVTNMPRGSDELPSQTIRLFLTVVLCIFLYRGSNWARWVAGILLVFGAVTSMILGFGITSSTPAGLLIVLMGLVYSASAVVLIFVPSVRAYFRAGNAQAG